MSKYVKYYNDRQEAYKTLATMASNYLADNKVSKEEFNGIAGFFRCVGKRFGLLESFRSQGLI